MEKNMQELMGREVAAKVSPKAFDANEMARALQQIPEAEREKLYYMIKGIQLMSNAEKAG